MGESGEEGALRSVRRLEKDKKNERTKGYATYQWQWWVISLNFGGNFIDVPTKEDLMTLLLGKDYAQSLQTPVQPE